MDNFDGMTPTELGRGINSVLREQREARLVKGETPLPEHFNNEKNPTLRKSAEREYAERLLSKPSVQLTSAEIRFLTSHARQCLQHGDD